MGPMGLMGLIRIVECASADSLRTDFFLYLPPPFQ
jgi:hypothetical protein